ncbi:phosphoglycan beta 1,3 galactosyltransferase [Leishmania major strain Friedlin]|uniref:Phosphoglycan beta 1,3 galactosyltransferase n=1 Tax=Leishmania major TaxID=5664 RepID=E9AC94_LEIMA|nr:phosphoglycan beta 1,3 galactosyltransferase [Leishmania major strain Friedlin]CBZ11909.1 phosphoglycan beta 1,3 galactosyltransferase [Leishmania major strain Friedlin]|eukprot:XP_003721625.1 phosphoglycan beta 1,3 galactosyltransferase [Leishmania major strain Friedlin]
MYICIRSLRSSARFLEETFFVLRERERGRGGGRGGGGRLHFRVFWQSSARVRKGGVHARACGPADTCSYTHTHRRHLAAEVRGCIAPLVVFSLPPLPLPPSPPGHCLRIPLVFRSDSRLWLCVCVCVAGGFVYSFSSPPPTFSFFFVSHCSAACVCARTRTGAPAPSLSLSVCVCVTLAFPVSVAQELAMSDEEHLRQGHLSSLALVLNRYGADDSEGGGGPAAYKCKASSVDGALASSATAQSVMVTGRTDLGGWRGTSSQHPSGRGSQHASAHTVNSAPTLPLLPQPPHMFAATTIASVAPTTPPEPSMKAHGSTHSIWGELRMAAGAAAVEGSVQPHRRDRAGLEENDARLLPVFLPPGPSAAAAAPSSVLRGSSWHRRPCACWRGRCSQVSLRMGSAAQTGHRWLRRYLRGTLEDAEREKDTSRRQKRRLGVRGLLLVSIVCIALMVFDVYSCVVRRLRRPHVPSWNGTLSILVQHEDAPRRMRLQYSRKVKWIHLPSWTLRVVPARCEDCLDNDTYVIALQRAVDGLERMQREDNARQRAELQAPHQQQQQPHAFGVGSGAASNVGAHGETAAPLTTVALEDLLRAKGGPYAVFANIGAPLGTIGPMLFAMCSLTDGVDVAAELPRWSWLRHASISSEARAAGPSPYIAVMGIHSADTVSHAQLRDAQRSTWLRYTVVARSENDFQGRLLPLYILAAQEREAATDPTWVGQDEDTGPVAAAEFCRPTLQEFADATNFYRALAVSASSGGAALGSFSYRQRRMSLRPEWRTSDLTSSPCDHIISSTLHGSADSPRPPLAVLAEHLRLPIIPAFTAAARFLCEASSGLWTEALQHSDVLWIDMLADRRETAKTERGDSRWRMAAQVGMTQRTVLWLEYAYHAFPDVPFIVKCYDDVYVKVPQIVSDFAYVLSGRRHRDLDANLMDNDGNAPLPVDAVRGAGDTLRTDAPLAAASQLRLPRSPESECVHWGLRDEKHFLQRQHMMTRTLARVVLEKPQEAYGTKGLRDVALLSLRDFNPIFADIYTDVAMTEEDRFIGSVLHDRRARAAQLCPHRRITRVEETMSRFHDLRRDARGIVTWASVALHRCTPADMYYLHKNYFVEEHRLSGGTTPAEAAAAERVAQERGAQWIRANINASLGPGWDNLNPVLRVPYSAHPEDAKPGILLLQDGVAVYNITF